jgi:glutathione S-transferase
MNFQPQASAFGEVRGRSRVKLYMHPVSNTSRPVRMFIKDNNLPVDEEVVDLMTGAHYQEPYSSINPNRMVPLLEDGEFRLSESSTILKYLADKFDLAAYPKDLKKRAKVNELMDWFNTNFYRDYGYGVVYPQIFPHHKRPSDEAHKGPIEWGKVEELAADFERPLAWQGEQVPDR